MEALDTITYVVVLNIMMDSSRYFFCGPPGADLKQILGIRKQHDVSSWFGNDRVFYVHKARIAIRRACDLLGLHAGTEILVPAYNCGSEIDPLIKCGATVVPYRVRRSSMIDLDDLHSRITSRTKAIYVTHYFGFPQPIAAIRDLCDQNDIYLIEDCALSLFSSNGATSLGVTGDVAVFSFPKTLAVPDGGVLIINNPDLKVQPWNMTQPYSMEVLKGMLPLLKSQVLRWSSDIPLLYPLFRSLLTKRRLTIVNVNNTKLKTMPNMPRSYYYDERISDMAVSATTKRLLRSFDVNHIIKRRRENFRHLFNMVSEHPVIELLFKELTEEVCPLYFPIILKDRNQLCAKLNEYSIAAIAWWSGYHRRLPWNKFPDACFLKDNVLNLPIHQGLDEGNMKYIADVLFSFLK